MQRADLEIVITLSDGTSFNGIRTYILRGCHSLRILRYLTILNLLLVSSYSPPQRCVTLHMIIRCHGQRCCVAADWQLERGELTARHHRVRVMLADSCHTFTATTKYPLDIYILFIRNGACASSPSWVLLLSLGQTNFTHRPNIPKYAAPVTLWSRRWWTAPELYKSVSLSHIGIVVLKYINIVIRIWNIWIFVVRIWQGKLSPCHHWPQDHCSQLWDTLVSEKIIREILACGKPVIGNRSSWWLQ